MLFNTRFWLVKVLLTPTIEKMIFSSAIYRLRLYFLSAAPGRPLPLVPRRADPPPPCGSPERFGQRYDEFPDFRPLRRNYSAPRGSQDTAAVQPYRKRLSPRRGKGTCPPPGTKAPSAVTSGPTGRFARASAGLPSQTADSDRRIVWRLRTEKQRYRKIRCLFMQFPQRMIINIFIIYVDLFAF